MRRHREGNTAQQARSTFDHLFHLLHLHEKNVREVDILFCGPNIAPGLHNTRHAFSYPGGSSIHRERDLTTNDDGCDNPGSTPTPVATDKRSLPFVDGNTSSSNSAFCNTDVAVRLSFNSDLYHDLPRSVLDSPHAIFLFNAGLWGYDDWVPTLQFLLVGSSRCSTTEPSFASLSAVSSLNQGDDAVHGKGMPVENRGSHDPTIPVEGRASSLVGVVVTSYCAEEAEDDVETMERVVSSSIGQSRKCALSRSGSYAISSAREEESQGSMGERMAATECIPLEGRCRWLWKPEVNPHRSLMPRRTTCGVEGRILFENHSWQAIHPP